MTMYTKEGKEIYMYILGNHIREKREELNLTQEELAENALLDPNHMGRIERGEKEPGSYLLWKIMHNLKADWTTISQEIEDTLMTLNKLEGD